MAFDTPQSDADPRNSEAALWQQWFAAAEDDAITEQIDALYAELDAKIAERSPTCWQSGKCCHFDTYGHRLYVTGLEIAVFLSRAERTQEQITAPGETLPVLSARECATAPACSYQHDKRCTVHAVRPLGCRIFFCQQGTQVWQQEFYEIYLQKLHALHDARGLPYRYMEWRTGLTEVSR